jgi:hypothetical protein
MGINLVKTTRMGLKLALLQLHFRIVFNLLFYEIEGCKIYCYPKIVNKFLRHFHCKTSLKLQNSTGNLMAFLVKY